eukprot:5998719-Amphidinium_carterae.1
MCDVPDDYCRMQEHFGRIDDKCGGPNNFDVPLQVQVDWHRWAHARTMSQGYFRGDSYKWLIDEDLVVRDVVISPYAPRMRLYPDGPSGLFPQNWPISVDPDELRLASTAAKILAALVMDDSDNKTSTDFLVPNYQVYESLGAEARIRAAANLVDLSQENIEVALEYAQEMVDEGQLQTHERVVERFLSLLEFRHNVMPCRLQ